MRFFFDNCIPPGLVRALRELLKNEGHDLVHLRDRFEADTPDDRWIPKIAQEGGWVLVTHDISIARSRHEREIWRKAGLPTFFFAKGIASKRPIEQMQVLARHWDEIVEIAEKMKRGASYVIKVKGRPESRTRKRHGK